MDGIVQEAKILLSDKARVRNAVGAFIGCVFMT